MSDAATAELIATCLSSRVLLFGSFKLKSGRQSPYFFNAGLLYSGSQLLALAQAFANLIIRSNLDFDVIFGPAYKGISLAAITAVELTRLGYSKDIGFAYNRKEVKDHGEGGSMVGAPLKGRKVLLLDDVITAGTAIRQAVDIVKAEGGTTVGIVELLDRQEKGNNGEPSAVQLLESELKVPVKAIITLQAIIDYLQAQDLKADGMAEHLEAVKQCALASIAHCFS